MKNNANVVDFRGNVCLYYSKDKKIFRKSTGIKVSDKKKYENIWREKFNNFEKLIVEYERNNNEYPTVEQVKRLYNLVNNTTDTIVSLYDAFVESKQDIAKTTKESLSYKRIYYVEYQKQYKVNVNKLDEDFVRNFQKMLFSWKKKPITDNYIDGEKYERLEKIGLNDNFSNMLLKGLKATIEYATTNNLIKKYEINWKSIFKKVSYEKFPEESLTLDEFKFIYSKRNTFNLEKKILDHCPFCSCKKLYRNNPKPLRFLCTDCGKTFYAEQGRTQRLKELKYKKALDMFLFQCLTSLRFSDMINKDFSDRIIDDCLFIKAKKTKNNQEIPLTPLTTEILKDNNYIFEWKDSGSSELNNYIKSILKRFSTEMPSFSKIVQDRYNVNNVECVDLVPRYMRFSSHSGRKTFITINLDETDLKDGEIMRMTGHKSYEIFQSYYNTRPSTDIKDKLLKIFS